MASKLSWEIDQTLFNCYQHLIKIRKAYPPREKLTTADVLVDYGEKWLRFSYPTEERQLMVLVVFEPVCVDALRGEVLFSTHNLSKSEESWEFKKAGAVCLLPF